MKPPRPWIVFFSLLLVSIVAVGAGSFYVLGSQSTSATTSPVTSGNCVSFSGVQKTQLTSTQFGEVTTYALPRPLRAPNSITSAPDGSVWFGEVAVPGVAHLFLNGTLVEYAWPFNYSSAPLCSDRSEIWGIVLLNGTVWATDPAHDQLVGLNPSRDTFQTIPLRNGSLPRYLALGPGQNLWFTETSTPAQIGRVDVVTGVTHYYSVPAPAGELSASVLFYNDTLAYVVTINLSNDFGQVFSFDPLQSSPTFVPVGGGNETLLGPYSVAVSQGGVWVGEHQASDVAFYNETSQQWTFFPTSVNPHIQTSLPYYLQANGSELWFNEHDGNKVAVISDDATSLTEYNMSGRSTRSVGIDNALTIAIDKNLVWFTGWTANTVGFVNASITPPFSISSPAASTVTSVAQGSSAQFLLDVTGTSASPLVLQFSDNEYHTAVPMNITFQTNASTLSLANGPRAVELTVTVNPDTPPGRYLLLATVTDTLTFRSVYIPIDVTPS